MTGRGIERTFSALEQLQSARDGLTLTELARPLGMAPSSAHDLLTGLQAAEVVAQAPGRRYTLGPRLIGLALSVVSSLDPLSLADQDSAELCERISEDVLVAVRAGDTVMYAVKHEGDSTLKVNVHLGQPRPLHATSVGKLFAAYASDLRTSALRGDRELPALTPMTITDPERLAQDLELIGCLGFAVSNQESITGVLGFAAPVFAADESVVLAIHVSLPAQRASADHLRIVVTETVKAAERATHRLGGTPKPPPDDLVAKVLEHVGIAGDRA